MEKSEITFLCSYLGQICVLLQIMYFTELNCLVIEWKNDLVENNSILNRGHRSLPNQNPISSRIHNWKCCNFFLACLVCLKPKCAILRLELLTECLKYMDFRIIHSVVSEYLTSDHFKTSSLTVALCSQHLLICLV